MYNIIANAVYSKKFMKANEIYAQLLSSELTNDDVISFTSVEFYFYSLTLHPHSSETEF